jgi:hypothetical protein
MNDDRARLRAAWRRHERGWADNRYVYAVVSRRSGGLSVGVNLNPDKGCNFDCIYCQVDRTIPPVVRTVDLDRLATELDLVLTGTSVAVDKPPQRPAARPAHVRTLRSRATATHDMPRLRGRGADAEAQRRFYLADSKTS